MVLFSVGTGTRSEVEWITRGVGRYFPDEWRRFRDGVPEPDRDGDLAAAYNRLLLDPDPAVHEQAARDWCAWEATHMGPDRRYDDPAFRLRFARLVTHYWSHGHFLEDGQILRDLDRLAAIPGILIHGRLDISGPLEVPWTIAQRWGDLIVVEREGHLGGQATTAAVAAAVARFA
jgi:proline iminopeptidase